MAPGPSNIDNHALAKSGRLPPEFLKGCGFQDWEIENAKLYDQSLTPAEIADVQNEVFRLRSDSPIQLRPLFISYTHADGAFVDAIEPLLDGAGIRYWRDIHDAPAGRFDKIIKRELGDCTMLLVLSENSVKAPWVEPEVNLSVKISRETGRDVLCPISLDDAWHSSEHMSGELRSQIRKYNVLEFHEWHDFDKLNDIFRRLKKGLNLFYPGSASTA